MQLPDKHYQTGLTYYLEALYAAGHFERLIIESVSQVADVDKMAAIARSFGVPKLEGGSVLCIRPNVDAMRDSTKENFWAWIGKEFWIPDSISSRMFLGFQVNDGRPNAAIMFRNNGAKFRERLIKLLEAIYLPYYHDDGSVETVIYQSLENTKSLGEFCDTLDKLIERLLTGLNTTGYFKTSLGDE